MTVQEKRDYIEKYCESREHCAGCPLEHEAFYGCYNHSVSECDINRNYEVLLNHRKNAPEDPIKPGYYNDSKITPFEVIDDWDLDFYLGNAVKYIKRAGKKKDNSCLQDLKKIREYVDQEIRKEELQNG